jgi:exportin-2 (importin alpha re-exporter)
MLSEFGADKSKWVSKDTAISLMLGIVIRKQSSRGVSELNHGINLMEFFSNHILPELHDKDQSSRPMVKAASLNFVCTFRNQFNAQQCNELLPCLIFHLGSPFVAVHSLAANTIEQILRNKETDSAGRSFEKVNQAMIQPFLQSLFQGLFNIVDNIGLNENEYVMKCIMTTLDKAGENVIPITNTIFEKLSAALERVCRNPRNPGFNHNLFESIAILVKSICSNESSQIQQLEQILFPPFQTILQAEILEFSPYVFQILAQLLEFRPSEAGLGDAFTSLFPPLLTASLWEKSGNVPGLTRLVRAYLKQAAPYLVLNNHLMPILGIFQKLNSSRATEGSAFDLLSAILQYAPRESVEPNFGTIFQLILTRLQGTKSNLYPIRFCQFLALFSGLYGGQSLHESLDKIQGNILLMLIQQIWLPKVKGCASNKMQAKYQIIGLTKLVSDLSPKLLVDDQGKVLFRQIVVSIISVLVSPTLSIDEKVTPDEAPMVYDATFSQLKYAQQLPDDAFKTVTDPLDFFLAALKNISTSNPGILPQLIQQGLSTQNPNVSENLSSSFQTMCQTKGFTLA